MRFGRANFEDPLHQFGSRAVAGLRSSDKTFPARGLSVTAISLAASRKRRPRRSACWQTLLSKMSRARSRFRQRSYRAQQGSQAGLFAPCARLIRDRTFRDSRHRLRLHLASRRVKRRGGRIVGEKYCSSEPMVMCQLFSDSNLHPLPLRRKLERA
jgi:hypothetical protein